MDCPAVTGQLLCLMISVLSPCAFAIPHESNPRMNNTSDRDSCSLLVHSTSVACAEGVVLSSHRSPYIRHDVMECFIPSLQRGSETLRVNKRGTWDSNPILPACKTQAWNLPTALPSPPLRGIQTATWAQSKWRFMETQTPLRANLLEPVSAR